MSSMVEQHNTPIDALPTKNGKHMRNWSDFAAKRSQAMPKNSLFGSSLERLGPEEEANKNGIDLVKHYQQEEEKWRPKRITSGLPDEVKSKLPDLSAIDKSKKQVEMQRLRAEGAAEVMDKLEEKALHFTLKPSDARNNVPYGDNVMNSKPHQWITERDIINARAVNHVGLGSANNYDRDRYRYRLPVHKYSNIGDILKPGMDFSTPRNGELYLSTYSNHFQSTHNNRVPTSPRRATSNLDLPPNIRHLFGTKVVDEILSDKDKVEETLKNQKELKKNSLKRFSPMLKAKELPKETPNPDYDALGNSIRQNVLPGYTFNHKTSHVKGNFTQDVWDRRYKDPDAYRYQRDYQSVWSEQLELDSRMRKKWKEYQDAQPKLTANWDREAKRPKPKQITVIQKPKTKPKLKPVEKSVARKNSLVFEDVVFTTPPMSPPLRQKTPERLPSQDFVEDKEFWNFYNNAT